MGLDTHNRPYGRVLRGRTLPYGVLAGASSELKSAVYYYGYAKDEDLPPLPELPAPTSSEYDISDVERRLDAQRLCALLQEATDRYVMSHRRLQVLYMRNIMDMTLEEIGDALGVGRERVRQIERRAERDCKRVLRALGVNDINDIN